MLAGDVGGTKTLLGLFERAAPRPRLVAARTYLTNQFTSFNAILDAFARDVGAPFVVDAAAAGVAGPVVGGVARLTNIAWDIERAQIGRAPEDARGCACSTISKRWRSAPACSDPTRWSSSSAARAAMTAMRR